MNFGLRHCRARACSFDYDAPAELFLSKRFGNKREKYRRFATAAEAIRYAVEDLRTPKAFGAWLEVGDERFNSSEIQRLYEATEYPLRSLSDRAARARSSTPRLMGPPRATNLREKTPAPRLQKRA